MPEPFPFSSADDLAQLDVCTLPLGSLCKKHNPNPYPNDFQQLVRDLNKILGPSSGIDSSDIDVNDLMKAMSDYTSTETDWKEYALADYSRHYTRNFVDHGNGKSNLLILVWSPGKGSLVHDHAGAHCIMKILKGTLRETQYEMPAVSGEPLSVRKTSVYNNDEVTYISDDIGLHKIENESKDQLAVSLHLYTPPYAEKNGCYCFDEQTGKKTKVEMCNYYSVYGKLKPSKVRSC
ncbi:RmlC-like cupin domain-containing protein [Trichophaea hybrida]|nr:RmlC-like cupin domain-containing protein [Trichophaea hybrida]